MRAFLPLAPFAVVAFAFSAFTPQMHAEPSVPVVEEVDDGFDFTAGSWQNALKLDQFMEPGAFSIMGKNFGSGAKVRTEVYLLRTAEALYIAAVCYDPDGLERRAKPKGEGEATPEGNKLEIFLDGDLHDKQSYYQMIINPAGHAWLAKDGVVLPAEQWTHEVEQSGEAWKVRVRVPYSSIGISPDRTEILVGFFRDYQPLAEGGERKYSTWKGAGIANFSSLPSLTLEPLQKP